MPGGMSFEEAVRLLERATPVVYAGVEVLGIAGAPGTGKNHFGRYLRERGWGQVVRHKTRPPRADEVPGIDAHFVSRDRFLRMKSAGEIVGVMELFGGDLYGYRVDCFLEAVGASGQCYVAEGLNFLPLMTDPRLERFRTASVFLLPPSLDSLLERIVHRTTLGREFVSEGELVQFLLANKVTQRLEYAFTDLEESVAADDPRRSHLADRYVVYDDPARVAGLLGL